ncbi:hypothetical protein HPP92_015458 [Vanilla planifolia]|nr:hypothetical protein HPP92_015458 [Vanilla planifolia]
MDSNDLSLPFKAGQEAESRSFEEGYRSAWFRCKPQLLSAYGSFLKGRIHSIGLLHYALHLAELCAWRDVTSFVVT